MTHRLLVPVVLSACSDYKVTEIPEPDVRPELRATPDKLHYGNLAPGSDATLVFEVENLGPGAATIDAVQVVGSTAFIVTTELSGTELDDGEAIEVTLQYQALSLEDTGQVIISSDALNPQVYVDAFGGTIMPILQVTPPVLEFDSFAGEQVDDVVVINNIGTAPLTVEAVLTDGDVFDDDGEVPFDLGPGESQEVKVFFAPEEVGTYKGTTWVDSTAGSESVALYGEWAVCHTLAEAWDRGWLEVRYTGADHEIENLGPGDVCMDDWYLFFTDVSQDAALGRDGIGNDAGNVLEVATKDTHTFAYDPNAIGGEDGTWFCIEETQVTTNTDDFWFFGARAPEPLRGHMERGGWYSQEDIWADIRENPMLVVGRSNNVLDVEAGSAQQVEVKVLNLGRLDGSAVVTEIVADHLMVTDPGSAVMTPNTDGTTTLVWDVFLEAAIDTPENEPTIYDIALLPYSVEVIECPGTRSVDAFPQSVYTDDSGNDRTANGSALITLCTD